MKTEVVFETRNGRELSRRKEFYDNGALFREGLYGKANGAWTWDVAIGIVKTYHRNGKISIEEQFDDAGTLDGETNHYKSDGKLIKKIIYKAGIKIQETVYEKPAKTLTIKKH